MLLSFLVQIRTNVLKLKKLLTENFIGVMDLNLAILVNREFLLFQLSVLYLNYAALENGKTHHVLLIKLSNNIPTMSHYS